jgi:hypothetical protein
MKNLTFLFFILLISSFTKHSETEYLISEEKVYLKIGTNTTQAELIKISAELLAERNINIDFQDSEFNDDGKIINLDLSVDFNDGNTGSTHAEQIALMINKFGFSRDYTGDSKAPIHIGSFN